MSSAVGKRVVITGMATINPLGDTLEDYIKNLLSGKSGIRRFESLDLSATDCKIGGDLGDYDCSGALVKLKDVLGEARFKKIRKLFRPATFSSKVSVLTALSAYHDSGLIFEETDPYRIGAIVGGHNLNSNYLLNNGLQFVKEPDFIDALSGVEGIDPAVPGLITESLDLYGPSFTVGGACASGNLALRLGFKDIISGECDRCVVTGALFDFSSADIYASEFIGAVVSKPEYQDKPETASRPFDKKRAGFVYSHGAGTLILEDYALAKARGARIYAEVLGVMANANANHQPQPNGAMQSRLIQDLLKHTGIAREEVDYVNCHATGTPVGDIEEIMAIKDAFGPHAYKLKINAPKSMLGHVCWSAPIVETIGGILQMQAGELHPTTNLEEPADEADLDLCANKSVKFQSNLMLKNSFGFGGMNSCSLIKRHIE
ncbi:MAG: beta-ketoacyl-ACP synthase [Spirochaetales bacterium]|nr:beta-ketoacyl-ACP synthase [Spirochaetales bacterium]